MEAIKSLFAINQDFLLIEEELENNGGELTEELKQALEITKKDMVAKGTSYVHVIKKYEAEIAGLKVYEDQIAKLKKRKQKAIEYLETRLEEAVKSFGDIESDLFKITLRKSESVEITDSEKIPAFFLDVKVVQTPKKAEIKKAIKEGVIVPGAELVENRNLSIK